MPVPAFVIKMMYGEMSEVVLASQRVLPEVAETGRYHFSFCDLTQAIENVLA
ncbi:MAG: DUF1731 domain-containing protein [Acidobacteriaceae bacterium]|nr:DUF1731 domain-containing protein [Acidobacteriaceae bacterium]